MPEPRPAVRMNVSMHAEPNVTPFLDVLLVLLIIFMYLCLNQQKVITANLPDPTPVPGVTSEQIVLEVQPNGSYEINTHPVAASRLDAEIHALYDNRPVKTMIIRAAKGVRYQDVVTAIDIVKGAGVVAVGLK